MRQHSQGFTLIELLISIAIIGMLASVLIPNLLGTRKRAYDTVALNCGRALATAAAVWRVDHHSEPGYPSASVFYGDATRAGLYGTDPCNDSNLTVSGAAVTNSTTYVFTVQHAHGKKTFTITESGISGS